MVFREQSDVFRKSETRSIYWWYKVCMQREHTNVYIKYKMPIDKSLKRFSLLQLAVAGKLEEASLLRQTRV